MPNRVDVTQDEIPTLIVAMLRRVLNLNDQRCYETERPDMLPRVPSGSDYVLTVSTGDGSFPIPEQMPEQANEEFDLTIMGFFRVNLDPPNADTMLLHEVKRGAFPVKRRILKAMLSAQDLQRENGDYFLRDLLYAKRSIAPAAMEHKVGTIGSVGVVFGVSFDWNLSGDY